MKEIFTVCDKSCMLYILENNIVHEINKKNSNSNEFALLKVIITE
jgi:hypothetical protein